MTRPLTISCEHCGKKTDGRKGQKYCQRMECQQVRRQKINNRLPRKTERRQHKWNVAGKVYSTPELKAKLELEEIEPETRVVRLPDQSEFIVRYSAKSRNGIRSMRIYPEKRII